MRWSEPDILVKLNSVSTKDKPYSDTSKTYTANTRIYGDIKDLFPSSHATAKL
jgi:hypothetical protein